MSTSFKRIARVWRRRAVLAGAVVLGFAPLAPATANTLLPTFMSVDVPAGTEGGATPGTIVLDQSASITFTDDVFLNTLAFGSTVFSGASAFALALDLQVISGRNQINVEWGDDDSRGTVTDPVTGAVTAVGDGNPNPMAAIGRPDSDKESTDPLIQEPGLLRVFNTLSLTEMTDNEGRADSTFKVLFEKGVRDDDVEVDETPEIVIMERGLNDTFEIRLILGGTFDDPLLSDALQIRSNDFQRMGVRADTTEISRAQDIGVAGFDLSSWGLGAGQSVFGFVYSGRGADLSGILASSATGDFVDPLTPVPVPAGVLLLLTGIGGLGGLAALRRNRG